MSDYLKAGIVNRYKILRASLILMILSLILFFAGLIVYEFLIVDELLSVFIGLASFLFIIGVFLFISYLIITNKTTKWFKNSHMLHNEIEYNLEHQQIRFVKKNIIIFDSVINIGIFAFSYNPLMDVTILGNTNRFNNNWTLIGFPLEIMPE